MESRIENLRLALKGQGYSGNWDYDPYMCGMYNGLEFALATLEGRTPEYKTAPNVWARDRLLNQGEVVEKVATVDEFERELDNNPIETNEPLAELLARPKRWG